MQCAFESIKDVNYLRTFEAAGELKSYRIKKRCAFGAAAFCIGIAVSGIIWKASISEIRLFDYLKNISWIKTFQVSHQVKEAFSTYFPLCAGAAASLKTIFILIDKDRQIFDWKIVL